MSNYIVGQNPRGYPQMMNYSMELCSLTKHADNGFLQVYSPADNAADIVIKALMK